MTTRATTGPVMRLIRVGMAFGGTQALADASMDLYAGEVHCLLGDNGAGKSTLIKIMSGVYQPTDGHMLLDGAGAAFDSPRHAQELGVATVHQDVGMIPLMSVARNFFLGREPRTGTWPLRHIDTKRAAEIALAEVQAMGIRRVTDANQLVGTLSGGERQALAIARAMHFGARILILDEPTSALGVREATIVLKQIDKARRRGLAVVLITHNVAHALSVGDRFTVLIQGKVAAGWLRGEKGRDAVLDLMAGGETVEDLFEKGEAVNDPFQSLGTA